MSRLQPAITHFAMAKFTSSLVISSLASLGAASGCTRENENALLDRCAAAQLVVVATVNRYKDSPIVFRTDSEELFWDDRPGKVQFTSDEAKASHFAEVQAQKAKLTQKAWQNLEAPNVEDNGRSMPDADKPLVQSLFENDPGNAVAACPSIQQLLRRTKVKFGDKAIAAIPAADHATVRAYVELPAVADDGATSIVYWSGYGGALSKLVRNRQGQWQVVGWLPLWHI